MIKIICIGKIKESFFREAISEYEKRLSKYTKLEIVELDECKIDNPTIALEYEKSNILNKIKEKDYIITLEIDGEELDSIEMANKINKLMINYSNIVFIIGSSYGLHDEIKAKANFHLSFSKFTFPHQMFRVILLEQLFRSFKILNNETYHK
jgi:23S rRNA (pseudouridine1915-N3)-methyltransferase